MDITCSFVRDYLETLPTPICTDTVTDKQINQLVKDVNEATKQICKTTVIDLNNEEIEETWFNELEEYSISIYKMQYYEDMEKLL